MESLKPNTNNTQETYYNAKELSIMLGVSAHVIRVSGKDPAHPFPAPVPDLLAGGNKLWRKQDIDAFCKRVERENRLTERRKYRPRKTSEE